MSANEVDLRKQRKVEATVNIDSTGLATEAKQDAQITLATTLNGYVDSLEALLTTLNGKDFATETTLVLIKGYVDGIETLLNTISTNTTGLNLEATQLLIKGVLDNIKAKTDNLDVALSTRATEATLIQVRDYLDTVETKLQSIIDGLTNTLWPTANNTNVSQSNISVTILSANTNRKEAVIRNDSNHILYLHRGATATTDSSIKLSKDDYFIEDKYNGIITGIWSSSGSGFARITEITT
jgi:hypothetical protein